MRSPSPRSAVPVIDPSLQNSSHVRAEPAKHLEEDPDATVSMEMARDALLAVIDSSKRAEELRKEKGGVKQNGSREPEDGKPGIGSVDPGRQEKLDEIQDDLEEEGQEMGLSELLTQVPFFSPGHFPAVLTLPRNPSHPRHRHELSDSVRYFYPTI